jgi:hypothetical protein
MRELKVEFQGLHWIKCFFSKRNNKQRSETAYRMGENMCNYTYDKGVISETLGNPEIQ